MKIGIVCYPTFGGSGILATNLGYILADKGHIVHFISYSQPVMLSLVKKNLFYHEVCLQEYPLFLHQPYVLALSSKLLEVVLKFKLDIIHVHYAIPHAYSAFMAKMMLLEYGIKIPIVTTLHGTDITLVGKHPSYKPTVSFSINHSDAVTAVSESLKQDTLSIFDIKREIQVVHNFICALGEELTISNYNRSCIADNNERIITHVSNFRKVKRITDVIQIFHGIVQKIPSVLVLVGEGPEKEKSEQLARELGIYDRVRFFGNTVELNKIYYYSDLFLLPSEKESFGLAALEAMAFNVPVISTNTGGLPEVNKHGFSGYLSEVGDVKSMVEYSLRILESEDILQKFKKNAKKHSEQFKAINIVPKYEEIYKRCLRDAK